VVALKPGDQISHYRIVDKIGEGGMGLVFRAEDLLLQRPVAIKMLCCDPAGGSDAKVRLLREARAAAALNHPNICTIYEVHDSGDDSFIAMELIEGETLHALLGRAGPLPFDRLLDIAVEIADGLAEAHARRIVHRDLKPQNIMVTPAGRVKILDFGLAVPARAGAGTSDPAAKSVASAAGTPHPAPASGPSTQSGERSDRLHGTLPYMSPEQALGRLVDARSDIFSFGTVLYEMAIGRSPFQADGATATLARILEAEPEAPELLKPGLPAGFTRVLQRCHRKKPEERYDDARELVRVLLDLRGAAAAAAGGARTVAWAGGPATATGSPATTPRGRGAVPMSPSTIAVLPFAVRGSERFGYLGEGMVDLMSTKLDGAGELRSVDANVVLGNLARTTGGGVAPDRARALAERLGAGLFVLGNIMEAGGRLQINASLYETPDIGPACARGSVEGEADGIFAMVDDLTTQLLTTRCGGPDTRFTRVAALATGSFAALKAYLEGEAEMRAMRRDPAVEAYRRSVAIDPGFALSWYRMSVAALWSGQADVAAEAADQADRHRARLSERDGRLLDAFRAVLQASNDEAERLYRSLLGAHPDDVEAWYQLGEIQFHAGPLRGRPIADSLPAWERVVALDPGHVNGLVHLAAIVASAGDRKGFERLSQRVLDLSPSGDAATWIRAVRAFALGDAAVQEVVESELRRASDQAVNWAIRAVAAYLGDLEGALRLTTAAIDPVRSPEVRALGHGIRAHLEMARGRWIPAQASLEAALALDRDQAMMYRALMTAAPFMPAPASRLEAMRAEVERWEPAPATMTRGPAAKLLPRADLYPHQRLYLLGLLGARLGDHGAILLRAAALAAAPAPPDVTLLVAEMVAGLRARVDWAEGRRDQALEALLKARRPVRFDLVFPSPLHSQADERFTLAGWLEERGRPEEALPWYSSFLRGSAHDLVYAAPAHLRRAAIHERRGETALAVEQFGRFAAAWRDCDPELAPLRAEAEDGLERLRPR
jgi:tetratricopeptide (TPR) repeat protein